jgi:glycosyltransferase involved in cell wall biosynthesis
MLNAKRFHLIALPHLPVTKKHSSCAYTQKIYQFSRMMIERGHEVYLYGAEGTDAPCTEFIQIISKKEQELLYGVWPEEAMYPIKWEPQLPLWTLTNSKAIVEILARKKPKDFLLISGGGCQQAIAAAMSSDIMVVEPFIGYYGIFAPYRVFESYTHLSVCCGQKNSQNQPSAYDWVIPNYYDINDFPFQAKKDNYFLYIGRMNKLKGVEIACQAAQAADVPILLAGQGVKKYKQGHIICEEFEIKYPKATYIGVLGVKDRAVVMGKARACFVPTQYLEPFGGVNVEAQLCGTPVITSDWAAFSETVEQARTGYRCRTLKHYVDATRLVGQLDYRYIRDRAISLYSTERVGGMFEEFFERLTDLWDTQKGWNKLDGTSNPNWLNPMPAEEQGMITVK